MENNQVNTFDSKRAMSLDDRLEVASFYGSFDGSIHSLYSFGMSHSNSLNFSTFNIKFVR